MAARSPLARAQLEALAAMIPPAPPPGVGIGGDALSIDTMLTVLTRAHLYDPREKAPGRDGKYFVRCFKRAQHSERSEKITTTTVVLAPGYAGRTAWGYECRRDHCQDLSFTDLLRFLRLSLRPEPDEEARTVADAPPPRRDTEDTESDIAVFPPTTPPPQPPPPTTPPKGPAGARPADENQAAQLVRLATDAELFLATGDDTPFATIDVEGHRETWRIRSAGFKRWLSRLFYAEAKKPPGAQAMQDALLVLEGKAQYEGGRYPVHTRMADADGHIYLDLATEEWEALEITPTGWRVVADPPVRFRRVRGMLALPTPEPGGTLDDLRPLVNVADEDDFLLCLAWLIGTLHPRGPYPVLGLRGEHGSAKSTLARILRGVVDPHHTELRAPPRDERDLVIAATNAWVVAFDNLGLIADWLSDALSRLATGTGFGTRELYSDDEEKLFSAARPIILNGIEEVITQPDLMDRAILIELEPLAMHQRQSEQAIRAAFEAQWPALLGALATAVQSALANAAAVSLVELPRMADFALWIAAAAPGFNRMPEEFLDAYRTNQASAHESTLDASLVGGVLRRYLAEKQHRWDGLLQTLLEELTRAAGDTLAKEKGWPKTPRGLTGALRRLAPVLRAVGITYSVDRDSQSNLATVCFPAAVGRPERVGK